jgi:hypothetical protein
MNSGPHDNCKSYIEDTRHMQYHRTPVHKRVTNDFATILYARDRRVGVITREDLNLFNHND